MQASATAASTGSSSTVSISSRTGLDRSSIRGGGSDAAATAAVVSRVPRASTMPRTIAQVVLGLVRARRGDPGQWAPLNEAWALSEPTRESLRFGPAAAARAEAAWLERRHEAVAGATQAALEIAMREELSWMIGELAYWRWRAGIEEAVPEKAGGALCGSDRRRLGAFRQDLVRPRLSIRGGARACRRGRGGAVAAGVERVAATRRAARRGDRRGPASRARREGVPRGPRPATRTTQRG